MSALPEYIDGIGFTGPIANLVQVRNPRDPNTQVIDFPMAAPTADLAKIGLAASATLGAPFSTPVTGLPGLPEMMHDHQQARAFAARGQPTFSCTCAAC